jgi:protein associated with RNAse G/E
MNIFDKYVFTSDGTWFVKGTRVFMDFFNDSTVCPYGIRQSDGFGECDRVEGEYYLDEEACGIDEFFINGKSYEDMTSEELEVIEKEYEEERKKYSKEELKKIADEMMLEEMHKLSVKMLKEFRLLHSMYIKNKLEYVRTFK